MWCPVPKWIGKCPSCDTWNSYQEELKIVDQNENPIRTSWKSGNSDQKPKHAIRLDQIEVGNLKRIDTSDDELNRVLGGGLVKGSVILLAGQPGIGKSTLLLQISMSLKAGKTLYVSGEESEEQISLRAKDLGKILIDVFTSRNSFGFHFGRSHCLKTRIADHRFDPNIILTIA